MNIQLKDLSDILLCNGIVLERNKIEGWQARISDFDEYGDMYIVSIYACNNNVVLVIQKEPIEI